MKIDHSVAEKQKKAPKTGCLETATAKNQLVYNNLFTFYVSASVSANMLAPVPGHLRAGRHSAEGSSHFP